jgi:hypothetical protein
MVVHGSPQGRSLRALVARMASTTADIYALLSLQAGVARDARALRRSA